MYIHVNPFHYCVCIRYVAYPYSRLVPSNQKRRISITLIPRGVARGDVDDGPSLYRSSNHALTQVKIHTA
jgi:hypothetical protein